jgi:enolase
LSATRIESVLAWEALDSRGNPTVACEVRLAGGANGTATVPSGASTGSHEAHELRDGGERYGGRGVHRAVAAAAGELADAVRGMDAADTAALDAALRRADGSPHLSRLGANAVLAISVAAAVAAASAEGMPLHRWLLGGAAPLLPMPMVNIVSGGAHAGRAVDLQDVLAVPLGAGCFAEAIEWAWRVRRATAELVTARGLNAALVADEGGLGPALASNEDALELVAMGIERAGLRPLEDCAIAVDIAATQFQAGEGYRLAVEDRSLDAASLVELLGGWARRYPIVSIEDPLGEDDWEGWRLAATRLGYLQLLGDDLLVTDRERVERALDEGCANAVLVKPNQTGTLSSAAEVVDLARRSGWATVLSARSGETEDGWLADLAVGWRTGQIKVGSTMRSERTAKWNRLLRIEAELGAAAEFAGRRTLAGRRAAGG